jgi:hypothetical protein
VTIASRRLHSSGAGVSEPDPDASYVAIAIARCPAAREEKQSSWWPHRAVASRRRRSCRSRPSSLPSSSPTAVVAVC